ncbi:hypothetical protein CKO24_02295 [Rhodothalassium salexigens DSM 2132]|nr:hypothetical protein [Rhodothalassium salexigens DSM 2132]
MASSTGPVGAAIARPPRPAPSGRGFAFAASARLSQSAGRGLTRWSAHCGTGPRLGPRIASRDAMLYRQTIRWARAAELALAIDAGRERAQEALDALRRQRDDDRRPYLCLPARTDDLPAIEARAEAIRASGVGDVVVLGTGGSSLGTRALLALDGPTLGASSGLRVHVPDNLGATLMDAVLRDLDPARTHFIAVSKSGGTAETVAQTLTAFEAVSAALGPTRAAQAFTLVSEPGGSPLRRLAGQWGVATLDHDPDLGGRYSVMSVVGALPALLAGFDIAALRRGAGRVVDQALAPGADPAHVPAAEAAVLGHVAGEAAGAAIAVLLAYDDRLAPFTRWWAQLWAESLGKRGLGSTPVAALGPVDQHSQLQLYLDGPGDKLISLVKPVTAGTGPRVAPALTAGAGEGRLDYLSGRTIGDLVDAEADATAEALVRRGRPVRVLTIDRVDAETLGALMMHFMLETVITAHLIAVDPFDQPAVEEGKQLTRAALRGTGDALAAAVPAGLVSDLGVSAT